MQENVKEAPWPYSIKSTIILIISDEADRAIDDRNAAMECSLVVEEV
jgi:hypothetical protein